MAMSQRSSFTNGREVGQWVEGLRGRSCRGGRAQRDLRMESSSGGAPYGTPISSGGREKARTSGGISADLSPLQGGGAHNPSEVMMILIDAADSTVREAGRSVP